MTQLPLPQLKYGLTTYVSLEKFSVDKVAKAALTASPYTAQGAEKIQIQDLKEFWQSPRGKAIFQILQKHCTTTVDADTLIIIAEKNSQSSIVESVTSTADCYLRTQRLHIILEENAQLSYCNVQNLNKKTYNFISKTANTGRQAKIYWIDGCFGSIFTTSMIHTTLSGEFSSMEADTMFFSQLEQQLAPHTTSDMRTKGVGKDSSKTVYRGNIKIHENAHNSVGYQKEDTLILSDNATVDAIPKLEIDNHDVKCKHGATVGQIDSEKLFYLTSRGLSDGEAQATIVRGFFAPTIQKINAQDLKERLHEERKSTRLNSSHM